ncbi:MAG: hypothetical protein KDA99_19710, partial [Planctomycetales bacterium]|nr:hypothetical protein [Planctomycetales bacterium]
MAYLVGGAIWIYTYDWHEGYIPVLVDPFVFGSDLETRLFGYGYVGNFIQLVLLQVIFFVSAGIQRQRHPIEGHRLVLPIIMTGSILVFLTCDELYVIRNVLDFVFSEKGYSPWLRDLTADIMHHLWGDERIWWLLWVFVLFKSTQHLDRYCALRRLVSWIWLCILATILVDALLCLLVYWAVDADPFRFRGWFGVYFESFDHCWWSIWENGIVHAPQLLP